MHTFLEYQGYRLSNDREFFTAPIKDVIKAIQNARNDLSDEDTSPEITEIAHDEESNIDDELISLGMKYEYGIGKFLQDEAKALDLYTKSLNLGNPDALYFIGNIYLNHNGNERKAIEYFKEGAARIQNKQGRVSCLEKLASLFVRIGHNRNALKCWESLFDLLDLDDMTRANSDAHDNAWINVESVFEYVETARKEGDELKYRDLLVERLRTEIHEAQQERENTPPTDGKNITLRTCVADYLMHCYIKAIEENDYAHIDKDFADGAWRDALRNLIEIDGMVYRLNEST